MFTINNKLSTNKAPFNSVCLAAKRVRGVLVFSDVGMPGTEAMAAEWHHLKSHQSPVQGLGLEKGQAHVSRSAKNEKVLSGLGAVSVT